MRNLKLAVYDETANAEREYREARERRRAMAMRADRIDSLGVDRSMLVDYPEGWMRPWSPEALAREPRLAALRSSTTTEARLEAFRALGKLPAARKVER